MKKIQFDCLPFSIFYKNAEIQIVVEDDVITTTKVFMDGECVFADDTITDENGNDLAYNSANKIAVIKMCANIIDKELAEDGRTECVNMTLVRR